ncbi:hypothetical protein [Piscinibacter sp. XHJ-5]|uniref:hypothetical protein n=1 Tax=Piscinibacter sp. XHJ-5 TaxID=3037797 RepID=UPI0024532724|nr:hypothetical protein [Piscinibacter sp. XHJ-5]
MEVLFWLAIGCLAGWLLDPLMRTERERGAFANGLVGAAAVLLACMVVVPLWAGDGFRVVGQLIVLLLGAVTMLALLDSLRSDPRD